MMKRSLYTFLATAAISTSAMIAPALVTPAAAQVGVSVNLGLPAMPMPFAVVQQPGYLYNAGYRGEGEHRYGEHGGWPSAATRSAPRGAPLRGAPRLGSSPLGASISSRQI